VPGNALAESLTRLADDEADAAVSQWLSALAYDGEWVCWDDGTRDPVPLLPAARPKTRKAGYREPPAPLQPSRPARQKKLAKE
jgi:hypothetical protein